MKKRILIIFIIVFAVICAFVIKRKNQFDETNFNKEFVLGQNSEDIVDSLSEEEKNEWIGEYELGENIIQICRIDAKTCDLMVFANEQISKDILFFDSDNKLSYSGEFLNETYNIILKRIMETSM